MPNLRVLKFTYRCLCLLLPELNNDHFPTFVSTNSAVMSTILPHNGRLLSTLSLRLFELDVCELISAFHMLEMPFNLHGPLADFGDFH